MSKRGRNSSSDLESPVYPDKKRVNMLQTEKIEEKCDSETNMIDSDLKWMRASLANVLREQEQLKQSLHEKIDSSTRELFHKIDKGFKDLHDRIDVEIGNLTTRIDDIEKRVQKIESIATNVQSEPFNPAVTVVAFGIAQHDNESEEQVAKDLVHNGIGLPETVVVRAARLNPRNGKPGLFKIELCSKEDKIRVLQNKHSLGLIDKYKRVYIKSSQTHAERLIELNFKTILGEIENGDSYRVTGNGRLIKRSENDGKLMDQRRKKRSDKLESGSLRASMVNRSNDPNMSPKYYFSVSQTGMGSHSVPVPEMNLQTPANRFRLEPDQKVEDCSRLSPPSRRSTQNFSPHVNLDEPGSSIEPLSQQCSPCVMQAGTSSASSTIHYDYPPPPVYQGNVSMPEKGVKPRPSRPELIFRPDPPVLAPR